jgi:hypothetical protein
VIFVKAHEEHRSDRITEALMRSVVFAPASRPGNEPANLDDEPPERTSDERRG